MRSSVGVPSVRTMTIGFVGLGAVAVIRSLLLIGLGGERIELAVSDLGELAVVAVAAFVVLAVARSFGKGESLRRQWTLIGLGVLSFAIGDAIWSWIELVMRQEVPYPGLPDVFYIAEYVFIGAGLLMATLAYSRLFDIRAAVGFAGTAGIVMMVLLYVGLFSPYILSDSSLAIGELVASIFYPTADVLFLVVPSLAMLLVVGRLAGGRLGWPWWFVAAGAIILAASDAFFSYLSAANAYAGGSIVDYGWMLAHVAFAVGASLAVDVSRPAKHHARKAGASS